MVGGTRIVAFDSAGTPAEDVTSTGQDVGPSIDLPPWEAEAPAPEPPADRRRPVLAGVALLVWTGFFVFAMRDRILGGADAAQWVELIRDWSIPVLLGAVVTFVRLRASGRESGRFRDAAHALAEESSRLESRLSVVNGELSLAREFIAAQSRDLESLGRRAVDRLSAEGDRLQGLVRDNHARVEAIGTVSAAALENMEKLRGQLPVIASSAKDVTNNIGNAGRTAYSQLQEMINGFKKLNEFGQASERQVYILRGLVDETIAEFGRQTERIGDVATARFTAFHDTGEAFRAKLEGYEAEALAAMRTRSAAMAAEVEQTRELLDANEAASLASMRARLSALREEGTTVARALRDGESSALDGWQAAVVRTKEELQGVLVALAEAEAEAAEASQARIAAISEELARLDQQTIERTASFAAEIDQRRAEALAEEETAVGRMHELMAALDHALASRQTRHAEIDEEATASLGQSLGAIDREIAERRALHERDEEQAIERLRDRFTTLDADIAERRGRHEAQGRVIAAQAEAIAARLADFERRFAEVAAQGSQAEATIAASVHALTDRLAASRSALTAIDGEITSLTDGSVRLLELIQASVKHGGEDLPQALSKGEARLAEIEARMAALREAASAADASGASLGQTIALADENLRRSHAELAALQAELDGASTAHGATLAGLRQELETITARSGELAEDARTRLKTALDELSRATQAALGSFGETGAAALSGLAQQLGSQTAGAIEQAMSESAAKTAGQLEQAVSNAAGVSREAALQLRDQFAKVNELAGNLESRVAHARQRAEEQVDNDFTRRVALITESLNSNAIDIAKALSTDVADTAWASYLRGDRGIFTRRAVSLIDNVEARAIAQIYERDREFNEHVSRYIHDFEAMLRQVLSARDGQALGVTLLSSDMGKLYVTLAQAIDRLRT